MGAEWHAKVSAPAPSCLPHWDPLTSEMGEQSQLLPTAVVSTQEWLPVLSERESMYS